jgi:hypothetical protein
MNLQSVCADEYINLAIDVIKLAIRDACLKRSFTIGTNRNRYTAAARRNNRILDARQWLRSDSDSPMSFKWYCQHMGADFDAVREAALKQIAEVEAKEAGLA